ncbi:MAG: hypothetical protein WA152_00155 [Microgenomates group bacterium]
MGNKHKGVLFVDFNGVISYNPFWNSLTNKKHKLHSYYPKIENLLFKSQNKIEGLVNDWMIGKYTSEEINKIISDKTGIDKDELFKIFCEDCKKLDISINILKLVKQLKDSWYCILRTDNMDSFHRFTIPANPILSESFHEIHSSYKIKSLKRSDGGKKYLDTIMSAGFKINDCVLIDDGQKNCELFEDLGGKAFCTKNEDEVLAVLKNLSATTRNRT